MEPQEIEDEEHEQVLQRVAAVDVAKEAGMVCTRVPHAARPGRRRTRVWEVAATTKAVLELGACLAGERIEKVTLEATSDYWRIWFYLLESAGLDVQLVNARDVKNVPGRPKTDKLDAVWLAKLHRAGHAAAQLRPAARDPPAAGLHPAAHRLDPGPDPALAAAGEAAGRRADQGVVRGQQPGHGVGPGHARGADRRGTRPAGAGRPGPRPDAGQARRPGGGADRPVR